MSNTGCDTVAQLIELNVREISSVVFFELSEVVHEELLERLLGKKIYVIIDGQEKFLFFICGLWYLICRENLVNKGFSLQWIVNEEWQWYDKSTKEMEAVLMDKKKTGNLIKDARTKKNYTQSELGDLLSVSNKAVSRWENGDSFPDVGVLENLAAVLDLRIQDIITGDIGINDDYVVAEVVRVAKLQQKEKKRKAIRNSVFIFAMLCCTISEFSVLGNSSILFVNDSILMYVILMVFSFVLILVGYTSQIEADKNDDNKFCKCMKIVSLFSLVWSILLIWYVSLRAINGHIPFGMKLSSVGTFINWQLISLFVINFVLIAFALYRYEKKDKKIHWGWFTSTAVIYSSVIYGDMLHRMSSSQEVIENLAKRTLILLATVTISLIAAKLFKKIKYFSKYIHKMLIGK